MLPSTNLAGFDDTADQFPVLAESRNSCARDRIPPMRSMLNCRMLMPTVDLRWKFNTACGAYFTRVRKDLTFPKTNIWGRGDLS